MRTFVKISNFILPFLFLFFIGCATLTPAKKFAIDVVTCRYMKIYVPQDLFLTDEQKSDRIEMTKTLRQQLNLSTDCDMGR
jgi:hypothetical protein